ncbi:MAG: protein TolR [Thermodesulfobacteriota bacterium]
MGASLNSGKNGRRAMMAEINVTPLVDVMLVLLIIFMVTAPMMTQGIDVNLPATTSKALPQKEDPLVVTINAGQEIFVNKVKVDANLLRQQLDSLAAADKNRLIYLRADKDVPYGLVATIMADIREAGFDKLGMVTQPAEKKD